MYMPVVRIFRVQQREEFRGIANSSLYPTTNITLLTSRGATSFEKDGRHKFHCVKICTWNIRVYPQ